ncbi:glutamine synthetase [Amycolatopsis acidicola]|uniref:glutamine synthetase n=1 Tax=Amycolatopsis acidicola TaxID=2596893 RepID=A0A5N0VIN8_9PSEU|nr:glutamine synthetase family protein [Amycolatopsis acidicola]KAA9165518.1 glutamine synthetase [Amycolatopsis acidicola]
MTTRSVDERPKSGGGGGAAARPMLAADRGGFVERHGLWSDEQYAAAAQLRRVMDEQGIELVRLSFCDQHGVLRGKTLTRDALAAALRNGCTAPSSLLLKDTSGKSVFPVFTPGAGLGIDGLAFAGDVVLVPDPSTFRVLPWAPRTGWLLCDLRFPGGDPVPVSTRDICGRVLGGLAGLGYAAKIGVELEFHVFHADGAATTGGGQLLHEEELDSVDEVVQLLQDALTGLDLPLRSIELEFGPNQLEVTLAPLTGLAAADAVVLCRSAIRQVCRRHGYHATFMSRPLGAASASAGWHLHQSLVDVGSGVNAFTPEEPGKPLSDTGRHYLGGLLRHAAAAAAFATPTVNGYKRYQPYSLAPDRIVWGADNKGAMVRAVGGHGDPATRLENRSGEPAANPYLYLASQLAAGLDGIGSAAEPGPPTTTPYDGEAQRLPASLAAALDALDADPLFADAFGREVIDWYVTLKRSEWQRYLNEVSEWEQREYFGFL